MSDRQVVDNKPSLRTLAYVLRNPELWPEGFEWNYNNCSTCAIGLALRLWNCGDVTSSFGIAQCRSDYIFCNYRLMTQQITGQGKVTPEQVADLIDMMAPAS